MDGEREREREREEVMTLEDGCGGEGTGDGGDGALFRVLYGMEEADMKFETTNFREET